MGSISAKKPHAVCVPYPAEGHVNPLMQLAKLLHSRGFHITYVNTEFNHKRLIRNKGPDSVKGLEDFRFETIPDGLPPSDRDATQDIWLLSDSVRKNCLDPFVELLNRLNSSGDVPPVSCIVGDGVMCFAIKAAEIIGVPNVQFWTASACGYTGNLYYSELIKRGIVPFKDENFMNDGRIDTPIDWIPGLQDIRLRDISTFIRTTDATDIMLDFMGTEARKCLDSPTIIFNTFDALEHRVLEALNSTHPRIYTIGPLPLLANHMPESEAKSLRSSLWKEDFECLKWLDKQKPQSVLYVNYGSITTMTEENFKEFAWGLANSKQPFLWICRPDIVMGGSVSLPEEFVEETKERGFITSWCPQSQVLNHPSVGAFLSHCGWNSTAESLCAGQPVICWPFFGEQVTNTRYLCNIWGCGMELNSKVKREDLEAIVREMMEGEKGKEMRKKAQDWKKKAEEATDVGGSSYVNFDRFVKVGLHFAG